MRFNIMTIGLKYFQNRALDLILTLMYCYGPKYSIEKSLTKIEKTMLENFSARLVKCRESFRETHPSQYKKYPLTPEENDAVTIVGISKPEIDYIITALRETILDCEIDDGYTLKVITDFDLDVAKELLKLFEKFREQINKQ